MQKETQPLDLFVNVDMTSVEARFLLAFVEAVKAGNDTVLKPMSWAVEVRDQLWLELTNFGQLNISQAPWRIAHKQIEMVRGSAVREACKAVIAAANRQKVDDILSDIGF